MECQTCRWWKAMPGQAMYGKCRRYPPQAGPDDDRQPITLNYDYCGEYAQAPTDPTPAAT
jgi:hypothetical protein